MSECNYERERREREERESVCLPFVFKQVWRRVRARVSESVRKRERVREGGGAREIEISSVNMVTICP